MTAGFKRMYGLYITGTRSVAAAYEMSYAVLHYKFNLPRQSYVYIGGMVGKLKGENDFVHSRFCTGTVYGINAGVALRVSNRVNITINESWRITTLQPDNKHPRYSGGLGLGYNSQPAATFLQYEPMELQQLSTTIGIGLKLF